MISVIIPVFNSPKELSILLRSIEQNTNFSIVKEVIVGNDCSDEITSGIIDKFCGHNSIISVKRTANLGFLANTNDLFTRATQPIVVLLNSDVIVPPQWAERVIAAMDSDSDIALACPYTTNATNLVITPGEGQNWLDVDEVVKQRDPSYPLCQPIVGFFLVIRRDVFLAEPLLEAAFGTGYWEDTDLHFRSISRGYRNVVIDNLFVFHSNHSPSFSQGNDLREINNNNKRIFMRRWADEYDEMEDAIRTVGLPTSPLTNDTTAVCRFSNRRDYDLLFVLPGAVSGVGGISIVLELVDELNLRGIRAGVLVTGTVDEEFVSTRFQTMPFRSVDAVRESAAKIDYVFSTSWDSHDLAKHLSRVFNAKFCNLCQGPEFAFNSGMFAGKIIANALDYDKIITVSPYLKEILGNYSIESVPIPVGPSPLKYYPARTNRHKKAIAVCLRSNPLKGTGVALGIAEIAKRAGYIIHVFGHDHASWRFDADEVVNHGKLGSAEIRKLFSSVEYYLDCSYMEGLGLLPLEAAYCGAVPILRRLNGLEGILEDGQNCHVLNRDTVPQTYFVQLPDPDQSGIRARALELSSLRSIEAATDAFASVLELNSGSFTGDVVPRYKPILSGASPDVAMLMSQIEQLRSSTSWRLTAPLRAAMTAIRRLG